MQLNDILEENSIKAISDRTRIPEENLEYLLASDFDALTKVKTLGFISILEREYNADLSALKEQALGYYGQSREEHLFPIGQLVMDEHRSKSWVLLIFIFGLLGFISWYFFTQFDKKHLNELIPFMDEQRIESFIGKDKAIKDENVAADLSIEKVIGNMPKTVENTIENDVMIPMSETLETPLNRETNAVEVEDNVTADSAIQSVF